MAHWVIGMLFLYFPEDKREYIPAAISFSLFLIACILVFIWIVKRSRKEEKRLQKIEEEIKRSLSRKK
ncbi:hypothetical protein [Fervidibacillus halotolerans]|uniref:Uncharacterized protein n=1 Tax=Fervidibacillus halotolerans TaxID=2980027 RepID=A0A9E8RY40_9BACI|nr:hypothetical protein [Fervidibacillus halotolerans]WAA11823.1 hypothetical protein OE105_09500 [Fervidibacillus halotolerans]